MCVISRLLSTFSFHPLAIKVVKLPPSFITQDAVAPESIIIYPRVNELMSCFFPFKIRFIVLFGYAILV